MSFPLDSLNNDQLLYSLNLKFRFKLIIKSKINNYLSLLPPELIHEIIHFLNIEELFNICQSNPNYQYLCSDPYIINKVTRKSLDNYYDKFNILEVLLKYRRDLTEGELNMIFIWASEDGRLKAVQLLLQNPRVNPAALNDEAIRAASENGELEVVQLLLNDPKVNPATDDNETIILASYRGHLEIVQLLLQDPRVNPADQNNGAIAAASGAGHLEVVKLLLQDFRVNPADQTNFAIRLANENGHLEVVKLLLQDPRVNPEHLTYEGLSKIY